MTSVARCTSWLGSCALLVAGCISPQNTRLPNLAFGDPRAERATYSYHDPLPERDPGAQMSARPRGFEIPRTQSRQARERNPDIGPLFPDGSAAAVPQASRYGQIVQP